MGQNRKVSLTQTMNHIVTFMDNYGRTPTMRELCKLTGLSRQPMHNRIATLCRQGLLEQVGDGSAWVIPRRNLHIEYTGGWPEETVMERTNGPQKTVSSIPEITHSGQ